MSNNVSKKITHINFILILLIVMLHSSCLRFLENPNIFVVYVYKMINVLCDVSVPFFFLMSAYLFYRNYNLSKVNDKYKSRLKSLVIPYFLWSIIFFVYYSVIAMLPGIERVFNVEFNLNIKNVFNNILMANCAEGMWFVRDLILYTIFSPIIYILMSKSKKLNYIILLLVFIFNLFFDFGYSNPIFWLPIYLLGVHIGIYEKRVDNEVELFKFSKMKLILSILSFYLFVQVTYFFNETSKIYYIYRMISPILLYLVLDLLKIYKIKEYKIEKSSFFIYCIHLPIIKIVRKILFLLFGYNQYISLFIYVSTIIITFFIIFIIIHLLKKHFKKLYELLTGSR